MLTKNYTRPLRFAKMKDSVNEFHEILQVQISKLQNSVLETIEESPVLLNLLKSMVKILWNWCKGLRIESSYPFFHPSITLYG